MILSWKVSGCVCVCVLRISEVQGEHRQFCGPPCFSFFHRISWIRNDRNNLSSKNFDLFFGERLLMVQKFGEFSHLGCIIKFCKIMGFKLPTSTGATDGHEFLGCFESSIDLWFMDCREGGRDPKLVTFICWLVFEIDKGLFYSNSCQIHLLTPK